MQLPCGCRASLRAGRGYLADSMGGGEAVPGSVPAGSLARMDAVALETRARQVLDRAAYEYFAGGSDDEITLRDNEASWQRLRLIPRVMRDLSSVSMERSLFGNQMAAPMLVAPMAFQRMAHPDGELAMARAAVAAGIPMVISTMATVTLEDIATAIGDSPRWFQFYLHRDRGLSRRLLERAEASGCSAVVLTVDVPVVGRRRRDESNRFHLPDGIAAANLEASLESGRGSALSEYSDAAFEPSLTPDLLEWIAGVTGLPLLVKGVLHPDDALKAVDAGASGVIVSNHGGRQLDGAIASADALPAVADSVAGRVPVLVDGGIRSGTDIVKALALGATAVLVGRPVLWGLAVGGEHGAVAVLDELAQELNRAMMLCGVKALEEIDASLIA